MVDPVGKAEYSNSMNSLFNEYLQWKLSWKSLFLWSFLRWQWSEWQTCSVKVDGITSRNDNINTLITFHSIKCLLWKLLTRKFMTSVRNNFCKWKHFYWNFPKQFLSSVVVHLDSKIALPADYLSVLCIVSRPFEVYLTNGPETQTNALGMCWWPCFKVAVLFDFPTMTELKAAYDPCPLHYLSLLVVLHDSSVQFFKQVARPPDSFAAQLAVIAIFHVDQLKNSLDERSNLKGITEASLYTHLAWLQMKNRSFPMAWLSISFAMTNWKLIEKWTRCALFTMFIVQFHAGFSCENSF